jgi:hypothetical protein
MTIKAFLSIVLANVFHILYLININDSSFKEDNSLNMDWMIQHMGSGGNYPNYKFTDSAPDSIALHYDIVQIQLIIRHGTRYPVTSGIQAITNTLHQLNSSPNTILTGWVKSYNNTYIAERTGQLHSHGQRELYLIGRRFAARYPTLIHNLVDKEGMITQRFRASSSWSSRTLQSAQSFCAGVFEKQGNLGAARLVTVPIFSLTKNNDSLIAFHKTCPRWQKEAKIRTAQIMAPVIEAYVGPIAARLTHALDIHVSVQDVLGFFSACRSEVAMHHTLDTFCKLFEKDDINKLEYIDDLKHYYKYAYGLPYINDKMACDLGKFILKSLDEAVKGKDAFALDIKFGHSETLLPLRTLLGLYQDDPPLSPNSTEKGLASRCFRLSKFGYFANNLAVQLLSHKSTKEKYVRVLDNEKPIVIDGCDSTMCSFSQFRAVLISRTQCEFRKLCNM